MHIFIIKIRQNVSDIVTYQEMILSAEYLQYLSALKNIYIPECLTCMNCWDEVKNLGKFNEKKMLF